MGEGRLATADPEAMMEGSGSGATPHETMDGSGSGAAPHETMEGSGSGATPHEVSPPTPGWGEARNGPAQMSRGRDLGIRPQNASVGQGRQHELLIPLFSSFFHFYFDLMAITFV